MLWGAAFKPGTDDVRDSHGLDVADRLCRLGAAVVVYDPQAAGNALVAFPHLGYADSAATAAREADAVLVVTAWPEFAALDPAETLPHQDHPERIRFTPGTHTSHQS